ncbi:HNH endonuclease, partial [Mycobacteroides abscessus]
HHHLLGHGWTTRKHPNGTTEWIPPPQLTLGEGRQLTPSY